MLYHHYRDVPRLGNVAVSRHAIEQAESLGVGDAVLEDVLFTGADTPDGMQVVWRQKFHIRMVVILRPEPFTGSRLVVTIYRVDPNAQGQRRLRNK